jgi:hypothetical protein
VIVVFTVWKHVTESYNSSAQPLLEIWALFKEGLEKRACREKEIKRERGLC